VDSFTQGSNDPQPGNTPTNTYFTLNPGQGGLVATVVAKSDGDGMFSVSLGTSNLQFRIGAGQWNFFRKSDVTGQFDGPIEFMSADIGNGVGTNLAILPGAWSVPDGAVLAVCS
jgi:hypothetical protein